MRRVANAVSVISARFCATSAHAFAASCLAVALISCGGGTSGTGLKTYEGTVKLDAETPLPNAEVTIEETGDSSVTDQNGDFLIRSAQVDGPVTFSIESEAIDSKVRLRNVTEDASHVSVDISIDSDTKRAAARQADLSASIVSGCASSFTTEEGVIKQIRRLPQGVTCTLKAIVHGDGTLRGGRLVAIQRSACGEDSPWRTIKTAVTDSGVHRGIAQIGFRFYDDRKSCRYRIVAPVNDDRYRPVTIPLSTLTDQRINKKE